MFDKFKKSTRSIDSVAECAFAITPSDASQLDTATRSIYVGTGGNITCTLVGDSAPVTFLNVVGGTILPIRLQNVLATGTTASDIVGLY